MFTNVIAFVTTWWKVGLAVFTALILSYNVGSCQGRRDGRQQMQSAIDRANTRALQEKARADELAANQRITDTIAVNRQEEALRNAIASTPDSQPDAVRIALGCQRLRAAGTDTARIPACSGSGSRTQARPAG